jgi:hypothetical protein
MIAAAVPCGREAPHERPGRRGERPLASDGGRCGRSSKNASGVNLKTYSRNHIERAAFILLIRPRIGSAMKPQQHGAGPSTSDFRNSRYDGAVRAKLGKTLRKRHDLREPLAPRLLELLAELDTSIHVRERTEAKLYAEVDDCVATMVQAAGRKPREPGEA